MRSFLTVLASSLLLSVPVHSHVASSTAHSYDLSHTNEHSDKNSDIRIYVKKGSTTWDSEKNNICHKNEAPCAEEDYDCHKFESTCAQKTTNRYGFRCKKKFFNQKQVMDAARKGCLKISKNDQKGKFPRAHLGEGYSKEGPYSEWPINKDGRYFSWCKFSRSLYAMDDTKELRSSKLQISSRDDYGLHRRWRNNYESKGVRLHDLFTRATLVILRYVDSLSGRDFQMLRESWRRDGKVESKWQPPACN
ncbi:putative secreted effector protein [Golovinomyces cichoracearum]|uniref:Putative secreted effector protein n=1 Tax=Golovinomyces cichoracearum TaxID=62708 RepID=A0A420ILI3_9PEZI|nr:putative secreted effector protein [Golovinomyces cichoracearum]